MTDKQAIDVTRCIHFDKSDIPNGCTCYWDSECNHDCYYKQLKRKEQECDELKQEKAEIQKYLGISHKTILERLEELTNFRDSDREKLDKLEEENKELKKVNDTLTVTRDKLLGDLWITEENLKDYIEHYNKQCYELDQLKQTLVEIKEIAEICSFTDSSELLLKRIKLILQKISEVIK